MVIYASNHSQEITYHASIVKDYFPSTFEDGTTEVNGLELILNSNGTTAYIRIPWISTTIGIHKLAGHIGVVIQSPTSVANESIGVCSFGCPAHSKVTVSKVVDQDLSGDCTKQAYSVCSINDFAILRPQTVGESYFDKCLFDVLKSNNSNSSWITLAMVNSLNLLGPDAPAYLSHNVTQVPEHENQQSTKDHALTSNASGSILCITMVTWCLSLYVMLYILLT